MKRTKDWIMRTRHKAQRGREATRVGYAWGEEPSGKQLRNRRKLKAAAEAGAFDKFGWALAEPSDEQLAARAERVARLRDTRVATRAALRTSTRSAAETAKRRLTARERRGSYVPEEARTSEQRAARDVAAEARRLSKGKFDSLEPWTPRPDVPSELLTNPAERIAEIQARQKHRRETEAVALIRATRRKVNRRVNAKLRRLRRKDAAELTPEQLASRQTARVKRRAYDIERLGLGIPAELRTTAQEIQYRAQLAYRRKSYAKQKDRK